MSKNVDFNLNVNTVNMENLVERLKELMENEARSCSMDFGCVTPLYAYRMFGGSVSIDEIDMALNYLKANNYGY